MRPSRVGQHGEMQRRFIAESVADTREVLSVTMAWPLEVAFKQNLAGGGLPPRPPLAEVIFCVDGVSVGDRGGRGGDSLLFSRRLLSVQRRKQHFR